MQLFDFNSLTFEDVALGIAGLAIVALFIYLIWDIRSSEARRRRAQKDRDWKRFQDQ